MFKRPFLLGALVASGVLTCAVGAQAGVPECGNIRLEDVGKCEIQGDLECDAGCTKLGVYKKACATKLHTVCRSECTFDADVICEDTCTESCTAECDRGENITCKHNCFGECVGSCDAQCQNADDPETCRASCEATCDGECDTRCKPLVDGDCYEHCIECCGGSCTAQANMNCQTSCQEESFEDCEYELKADCNASCSGSGALFCDGKFVLAGEDMLPCVKYLIAEGIGDVKVEGEIAAELDDLGAEATSKAKASTSCAVRPGAGSESWSAALALFAGGLVLVRRRRRA